MDLPGCIGQDAGNRQEHVERAVADLKGGERRSGARRSDFRQAGLKRQQLNFGALDPGVAIRRFVQLYECHGTLIL